MLPGSLPFVDGIIAAAIGTIANSVIVIARRSIMDIPTALITVAAMILLWEFNKLPEPVVVASVAVTGLLIYPLLYY